MITLLEQIAMNAWPAKQTQVYDGWILRFTNGVTRRANSINPLFESTLDIHNKIEYCESLYASQNLPPVYKITECVFPKDLDAILENKGYVKYAETSLQTIDISNITFSKQDRCIFNETFNKEWLERSLEQNKYDFARFDSYVDIFENIINPCCFIDIKIDNEYVGSGLAVYENGWVGLFDLIVQEKYRQQGYGTQILKALLHWGQIKGATKGYLQVMLNNPVALSLYEKLGFKEEYQYWYRIKE